MAALKARTAARQAFAYRPAGRGVAELHAEEVPLSRIAEAAGTPVYCYSTRAMVERYRSFGAAFKGTKTTICYALKANPNLAVVRTLARLGAGADVVSQGELRRALEAGVPPAKIVFSGVGKTAGELAAGLEAGIRQFNVESEPELVQLARLASRSGRRAPVALRVNPDVEARTHEKVSTGRRHDKFGISWERVPSLYGEAVRMPGIEPAGLAVHVGSQVTELGPFESAIGRLVDLARRLKAEGLPLPRLDLGGGLGISYGRETPPSAQAYAALVKGLTADLGLALIIEPGRAIIGPAGVLLTRVIYVKRSGSRTFVVVDAAMNDLLRPALYGASHPIDPVARPAAGASRRRVDIVGPVCETADTFARDLAMAPLEPGDLLAIGAAGAYGAVMASSYNSRPLVPEVLVKGDAFATVRARPSPKAMLAPDRFPPWLAEDR